jgi:cyclic dehypoxanthinyl futalosine synthase
LTPHTGAEIRGLDLTKPVDAETRAVLNEAFAKHHVLVVRDQKYEPADFKCAVQLWGELQPHDKKDHHIPGFPEMYYVTNQEFLGDRRMIPGETFHTDHSNHPAPPKATILYPVALPSRGGDTQYVNMHQAYDELSEAMKRKIDELKAIGGVQILMQGGHNPYIPFEWYLDLLRYIKRHHPIHIHGFSPSEVDFFAGRFGMSISEVIRELMAAGLDSIPGGGGEILVQSVRDQVARKKAGADRWLEVMEIAHGLGLRTSVTMMYGLGESTADRIEHLFRVREVQRKTHGFTAFICWPLQPENSELAHLPKTDAVTYLKTQAVARIVLEDVPNIQASWVTMGMKVGQVALRFGANDFGSLMMEENVVSAAGTTNRTTLSEMQRLIADAGYTPKKRRQDYTILEDAA